MTRVPIRWRLTLAFSAALAVVLVALAAFLYLRFAADLDRAIEGDLQARSDALVGLVESSTLSLNRPSVPALEADEDVAHILRPDGAVVAASSYPDVRLLTPTQLRAASQAAIFADRSGDGALDESLRLLATPVQTRSESLIVVVGASLDEKAEALASLLRQEAIGLVAALVASSAVGFGVAGLALRPVDALRSRAAEITPDTLAPDTRRLPVSAVDDELGRLGRTLNEMFDRIHVAQTAERQALEQQRRLVADASHQLRTPLTILKTEVELALLGSRDTTALRAALESAGAEADRLTRVTDHLLLLAAADDGVLALNREPLSVRQILLTVADRYHARAVAADRDLIVKMADDLVVQADQIRLEQAVGNLVDNALLHGDGNIELAAWQDTAGTHLAVTDSGPGFGDRAGAPTFARFQRGHGPHSGSGLGLAIVQAITQAHGGTVVAGSDDGTRITITIPH